jgi:hypothetical protein
MQEIELKHVFSAKTPLPRDPTWSPAKSTNTVARLRGCVALAQTLNNYQITAHTGSSIQNNVPNRHVTDQ